MLGFNKEKDNIKMSCKSNKKSGEVVCHGIRGEDSATVYGSMGEDGQFRIREMDGDMDIVREIENEMLQRTKSIKSQSGL